MRRQLPRLFASALACLSLAACPGKDSSLADGGSPDAGPTPDTGCALCPAYGSPVAEGVLPSGLTEISGLAMSADHPGVLFAHNDSGDTARFFAIDLGGNLLGEFALDGVAAVDWEDLAVGPCPSGRCVYLGDFGDNDQVRTDYAVYRVPVPDVDVGDRLGTVSLSDWERLPFEYPSAAKWNAETLLVHPLTGDVYVVNKLDDGEASSVFKFPQPLTPGVSATLTQVATLPIPGGDDQSRLTGGDIHPCGEALLLRTYDALYLFHLPALASSFDAIFTSPDYARVPVANEKQGEAVTWLPGGRGYATTSEGSGAAINVCRCP